jgi:RNA polymerase sigma-70 factor (ECF subfamily)
MSSLEHPVRVAREGVLPCEPAREPEAVYTGSAAATQATFEQVYDEHVDFVWRSAQRLGVDTAAADDVVQQVFLVVHRRLGEFEGRASLKSWIFGILLRVARDHRRGLRRKSPHSLHPPEDPALLADASASPDVALSRAEASRVIDLLLATLDEDKRVVFVLAELEQMTAPEISLATGLAPKAVYSRLRAARADFERAAADWRRRALWRKP